MPRILIVDDDSDLCNLVKVILERRGYKVDVAASGDECLLKLTEGPAPDLILMDFLLPGRDGIRVTREIKSDPRTSGIPVYLFTVAADEGWKREAERSMADGYIAKPFTVEEFVSAIERAFKK
ncbi:MAG: response regulator [Euryarchaeota archaeon]|nr:response regulator [Euryarchaeota archaeon]